MTTRRMPAADYLVTLLDAMSEDEFQGLVVEHARLNGWLVHHSRKARLLVLELKSAKGSERPMQVMWREALKAAGVDVRTVRPRDWAELKALLEGKG